MPNTLTLTFNNNPPVGDYIWVKVDAGPSGILVLNEQFVTLRTQAERVTKSANMNVLAQNYSVAWNFDHSNTGGVSNLLSYYSTNTVIITLLNPSWEFVAPTGTAISSGDVTWEINSEPVEEEPKVSVTGYSAYVTDPCNFIYVDATIKGGNGSYNIYHNGILQQSSQPSPVQVLIPRVSGIGLLQAYDTLGADMGFDNTKPPLKITETNIDVGVNNYSTGATLTIDVTTSILNKPLTYSLTNNGIDWQTENVFTGIAPGNYTVYVKDVFGCVSSKDVVVDGFTSITETIFTLSDINALRYFKVEEGKKNHKNTSSCSEVKQIASRYFHRYLDEDVIPTQFKTNAAYISALSIDLDGNTTPLTVIKHTENIGLTAKSTATHFSLGGGRSALYYGVVDLLNPLDDSVLETVDFGFTLPEWANTIGNTLVIDGIGELEIDAIGYSDEYDSFVVEFNYAYTGLPVERNVSALYNLQPYEVYQFNTYMNASPEYHHIAIMVGTSSENIDFTYISERIKKVVDNDKLIEINYWSDKNIGGMNYQTGIRHKLRLEGYWDYSGEQQTEGYDGDTDYFVTNNVVYDSQKFTFVRLSSEMAHKLRLVLAHKYLSLNGLFYKIAEVPDLKTAQTNNLKTLSVLLKRSGDQFLKEEDELITTSDSTEAITAGIEASQGKAMILWTKNNG